MKKATRKQLAYAQALGIDVNAGLGGSEVRDLIDHAQLREQQEGHGMLHVASEVAQAALSVGSASERKLRVLARMASLIKATGARPGAIIRYRYEDSSPTLHAEEIVGAVVAIDAQRLRLCATDLSRALQCPPYTYEGRLQMEVVYHPPEGFLSPACFIRSDEPFSLRQVVALIARVQPFLAMQDVFTGEYGTFWRTSAAWTVRAALVRQTQETAARAKAAKVKRVPRHCIACGASGVRRRFNRPSENLCLKCAARRGPLPLEGRHCIFCGASFNGKSAASARCEACTD